MKISKSKQTNNIESKEASTSLATGAPSPSLAADKEPNINEILGSTEADTLLRHYDRIICPHQIAQRVDGSKNPYRLYVLSLAYDQIGLLYAVLGLSACHLGHLKSDRHLYETVAVDYRVRAITALGACIRKVCSGDFTSNERDAAFATIQVLLLHDICESGISTHGAHISGAMSICSQLELHQHLTIKDERTVFFLGNLVWLDIIRAFSLPERICFSQELRKKLLSLCDLRFEAVNGCPREIVLVMGEILESAKAHSLGRLDRQRLDNTVRELIQKLYDWDISRCFYPDDDRLWVYIAEAFRHTCVLRAWRLLDPFEPSAELHIQKSVTSILDSLANVPGSSPLIELAVMPLFMAGADSLSPHSRHYVALRLGEIQARSQMGILAPQTLLERVWHARAQQPENDKRNIPWMLFTHNSESPHQDDYLII
ncbi:fungal-specific transcription factor domain-containing protein [Penicillium macrosclerotiorum]|uniref:fungal-specific transcription factor domain-containing protein n=1 Tax=Penicillium macrosclerotiorum TaxID=303699 RepID=UPI002547D1BE|nr:fungal-specific transcription factor domain-containing protein [Penicillium macrosclerotiorum]KAJ5683043.1 fungal-specific transcription factor domain-containing protein [Penicillium macrosclerotiorum]